MGKSGPAIMARMKGKELHRGGARALAFYFLKGNFFDTLYSNSSNNKTKSNANSNLVNPWTNTNNSNPGNNNLDTMNGKSNDNKSKSYL